MKYFSSIIVSVVLLFLQIPFLAVAETNGHLITGIKLVNADTTFRYVYLYNQNEKKVLETRSFQQNGVWVNLSQTEWFYESGNCTHQTERIWTKNGWLNNYEITNSYTNGTLTGEVHNHYENNILKPFREITYQNGQQGWMSKMEYAVQGNTSSLVLQTESKSSPLNRIDTVLVTSFNADTITGRYRTSNFYDQNNRLAVQQYSEKMPTDSDWKNISKTQWFYAANVDRVLSQRTKTWNEDLSDWENYQRTDFEYDSLGRVVFETGQQWKTMFWENDFRYGYVYGTDGSLLQKVFYQPLYHEWRDQQTITYSAFNEGRANLIESKYDFWGGNTGEPATTFLSFDFNGEWTVKKAETIQIFYTDSLLSSSPSSEQVSVLVYPNPSDGIFYIRTTNDILQSWTITDLSGRVLKVKLQPTYSGVVDITECPKGIYMLTIKTTGGIYTRKVIRN